MTKLKKQKPEGEKKFALVNDAGLNEAEMKQGAALVDSVPQLRQTFTEYRNAEGQFLSRFWTLALALRAPVTRDGVTARLNAREVRLALLSLGEIKQRITEWKRVIEMNVEDFERCRMAGFTKLQTLGVARGTLAIEGSGADAKAVQVGGDEAAKTAAQASKAKPSHHKFPKPIAAALLPWLAELKPTNDNIPYELSYEAPNGHTYEVRIFADSKPVLPVAE